MEHELQEKERKKAKNKQNKRIKTSVIKLGCLCYPTPTLLSKQKLYRYLCLPHMYLNTIDKKL